MNFDKYTHIENLTKVPEILGQEVVVTEKLHGSNIRFGWVNDFFYIGSRNNIIYDAKNGYNKQFDGYGFYNWALDIFLKKVMDNTCYINNCIFYGEFIGSGIQKGIKYFSENKKDFILFDMKDMKNGKYVDEVEFNTTAKDLNFQTAPLLYRGKLTIEKANELINCESAFGKANGVEGQVTEGIVIKPLKEIRNIHGERLIAKYKSDVFKESKKIRKEPKEIDKSFLAGMEFCTEARVINVIDKLRQEVNEDLGMQHVPLLLQLYNKDIQEDGEVEIPEDKQENKQFRKGASCNVVRFYKEWLAK